jgi:hypothetical protein
MIKNINLLFLLIISSILVSNCSTVKDAFDPNNKNNAEEFLVEKKSPLSMPPGFEELPMPLNEKIGNENQVNNIKLLINENNNEILETDVSDKGFDQYLLDKIKNN